MTRRSVDVLVAGGGGFIGGHLVADLLRQGKSVRSVDVKPPSEWYQVHPDAENVQADLSLLDAAMTTTAGAGEVFMLAADMGGMGFIENNKALCMLTVLTSTHMLQAAQQHGVERYFYSSSACVYAADKQTDTDITALVEADAYPAMPEDGYGWEKLFTERMCRHFSEDFGMTTGSPATTTSTVPRAPGPVAARRPRQRCAARSPRPRSPAITGSTSGATASRHAASRTSTTASRAAK